MAKERLKPLLTSFSSEGGYLAVLSRNGTVKVWSTIDGSLLAEWKQSDGESAIGYSCMAISSVGKKRKKEHGRCLLALGAKDGSVSTIDAFTGETKWKSTECHPGGVAGLSFVKKGRHLCIIGNNGTVFEINVETGEQIKDLKVSKRPISSLAFSSDQKLIAIASGKLRILELENGKEFVKFPKDVGPVQWMAISEDGRTLVTSEIGQNHLQVWNCDVSSRDVTRGPVLTLSHAPVAFECRSGCTGQDGPVILAVSESSSAYFWYLKRNSAEVNASKIIVKPKKSIFAAKIHSVGADLPVIAIMAYGSMDSPEFSLVEINSPGENIFITPKDDIVDLQENVVSTNGAASGDEANTPARDKKASKKRAAPDPDLPTARVLQDCGHDEDADGVLVDDDPNEPTMGEKLASLNLLDSDKGNSLQLDASPPNAMPPSADSVNVLLKQALHADDGALLLDCLYNRDEKVIANSVAKLNPSDVLKLLNSLVSIIQSRGAVLACALPWIKCLLLKHAGGIMSQESSMLALNAVYQLIESRVSTLRTAIEVSSTLDFLYMGIVDDLDEEADIGPVIYEDKDESYEEGEEPEDAMETNEEDGEAEDLHDEVVDGFSDFEGIDDMSE